MKTKSIGFVGGGRITRIFLQAFANKNLAFERIVVLEPNENSQDALKSINPHITTTADDLSGFAGCDIIFLATHPPVVLDALAKIKSYLGERSILVSLAPKITIDKMSLALDGFVNIARVNPSAPGIINQGINPVAFDEEMSADKRNELFELLGILGKVMTVSESKIEAYAVISAMGPTYFWFQLKQLKELALSFGMEECEAKEIIAEMLNGTVNTLFYSGLPAEEVMDLVPVRPLGEFEDIIKSHYTEKLTGVYTKIKP